MSKKTLYIVRGVSGSGKTTFAKELAAREHCLYFEADMFFVRVDGAYTFNPAKLPEAHEWCFGEALSEMENNRNVIVSNTFTRTWEMKKYLDAAVNHCYQIRIITCTGRYQNVHGLTEAMVEKQRSRFQSNLEIARELHYDRARFGMITYSNH